MVTPKKGIWRSRKFPFTRKSADALLRRHSVDPDRRRRPYNTYRSLETQQGEPYVCHTEEDALISETAAPILTELSLADS
ncbi:hypothetical protein TNCV_4400721 [Trichonephila clavipes]|nr:hypothetical protein TNCV_4400721 [Trichonephila clavipes]